MSARKLVQTTILCIAVQISYGFGIWSEVATACPFCTATSQTLSEEIATADVVVLAKVKKLSTQPTISQGGFSSNSTDTGDATFTIVEVLRGKEHLADVKEIEVAYFGGSDKDKTFFIPGFLLDSKIDWLLPDPLSPAAEDYILKIVTLPKTGPERLAFFQEFLECDDPRLRLDAYDEFGKAPYSDLIAMREHLKHDQIVRWILDSNTVSSRKGLYFTMLGVCNQKEDIQLLEYLMRPTLTEHHAASRMMAAVSLQMPAAIIQIPLFMLAKNHEFNKKQGLDALIACYLLLAGEEGLPIIEELFLKNTDATFGEVYATIMAIRFHGEETDVLPQEKLLGSMRLLLDHSTFADQIIPDLARWEDWTVLERLLQMFLDAKKNAYVRQPIVKYMIVASYQDGEVGERAKAALAKISELDSELVNNTRSMLSFGALGLAKKIKTKADAENSEIPKENVPESDGDETEQEKITDAVPSEAVDPLVEVEPLKAPQTLWIVAVPIAIGFVLMGCYWMILRGPSKRGSSV